jgi:hypothetical protein
VGVTRLEDGVGEGGAPALLWSRCGLGKLKGRSAVLVGLSVGLGQWWSVLALVVACEEDLWRSLDLQGGCWARFI